MAEEKYKFSVVIPIYNVEEYLRETIESVLAQDIGFAENIQMILVNDGSTDNSEQICLEYQTKYPDNIIYVKQENAGVSAARNHGMDYVKGKYVNFLDPDDVWSDNAFSEVYDFFIQHDSEINLVSCRQEFFEATSGIHPLSRTKFDQNRVIDILYAYNEVQLSVNSVFVKSETMRLSPFAVGMRYGEDARYVTEQILDKCKYGVVANPTYYYRKREQQSSAMQGKEKSLEWYLKIPYEFHQHIAEASVQKLGNVIPHIQYIICYDIKWRLTNHIARFLTKEQQKEYLELLQEILRMCDDTIILEQKDISIHKKIFMLSLKYGRDITADPYIYMDYGIIWNNLRIFRLNSFASIQLDVLTERQGRLVLSGRIMPSYARDMEFFVRDDKNRIYSIDKKKVPYKDTQMWRTGQQFQYIYEISLPLEDVGSYEICGILKGKYPFSPVVSTGKFAKLGGGVANTYTILGSYMITKDKNVLKIKRSGWLETRRQERKYVCELRSISERCTDEREKRALEDVLWYRKKYLQRKAVQKKKIWLVSDRVYVAGDNGEAFFEYLMQHRDPEIEPYFVMSKDAKDYERMKKIGRVLEFGSREHKLYTLLADKILSSQGDEHIINPFYEMGKYVRDLYHFDFVFLQHGITKDDLSVWLNKYNKNIALFVTAAVPEQRGILADPYCYTDDVVKLTGFPRFDKLVQENEPQKTIIFMPTWRQELSTVDPKTGKQYYNANFKKSEYYQFYNKLINDERIKEILRKTGYTGKFFVHNNLMSNAEDFEGNDVITVVTENADYRKEFVENAFLITDYSSVAFDFAYLRKPVVYIQCDREKFFSGAVYDQGYFNYDTMGFGPVCYDYEQAVDAIVNMVERDCRMDAKYQSRLEDFYYKFDQDNCRRVYEAVKEI